MKNLEETINQCHVQSEKNLEGNKFVDLSLAFDLFRSIC